MASIRKYIAKNGRESFHVQIRKKNYPSVTKVFYSLEEAERFARQSEQKITEYKLPIVPMSFLFSKYEHEILPFKKERVNEKRAIDFWKEKFGNVPCTELRLDFIINWLYELKERKTRRNTLYSWESVRKYYMVLSAVFQFGIKCNLLKQNILRNMQFSHLVPKKTALIPKMHKFKLKASFVEQLTQIYSADDIKKKLGTHKTTVQNLLKSDSNSSLKVIEEVCEKLGLEVEIKLRKKS